MPNPRVEFARVAAECLTVLEPSSGKKEKDPEKEPSSIDSEKSPSSSDTEEEIPKPSPRLVSLYWQNPLNANRVSQCVLKRLKFDESPPAPESFRRMRFLTTNAQGDQKVSFLIPKKTFEEFSKEEIKEILRVISDLNEASNLPMIQFSWDSKSSAFYSPKTHEIHLNPNSIFGLSLMDQTILSLAHEMGHGIFEKGFRDNQDWALIFGLSLLHQNFEMIDDSNYLIGLPDRIGHPDESANEAFGSAVHAFFLQADHLAAYIKSQKTPESLRQFGKLVWVFMREKVFKGKVFTTDGQDPFVDDSFQKVFKQVKEMSFKSSLADLKSNDDSTRALAAEFLGQLGLSGFDVTKAIPFLTKLSHEDPSPLVRMKADFTLMGLPPPPKKSFPLEVSLKIEGGLSLDRKWDFQEGVAMGLDYPRDKKLKFVSSLLYTHFQGRDRAGISLGGEYHLPQVPIFFGAGIIPQYDFEKKDLDLGISGVVAFKGSFFDQRLSLGISVGSLGLFKNEDRNLLLGVQVGWKIP